MSTRTHSEFNPAFFQGLFGSDIPEWEAFIEVTVKTFKEAQVKLREATNSGDMQTVSDTRHSIGPSLTQWGAVSLESELRSLEASNMAATWSELEPEFEALLAAFDSL